MTLSAQLSDLARRTHTCITSAPVRTLPVHWKLLYDPFRALCPLKPTKVGF